MAFSGSEAGVRLRERVIALGLANLANWIETVFEDNPHPELAAQNFERWLNSTANPETYLSHLAGSRKQFELLATILGSSQAISDILIQNPELATIVIDPDSPRLPTREAVVVEGRRLLSAATERAYRMDRLRYLKQRWMLPIVVHDLSNSADAHALWSALSELAEGLIELAAATCWSEYSQSRSLDAQSPVGIVAFGKLGGGELNYSSDIDIVFVLDDEASEEMEREATRFAEMLTRSVAERMGRGSLFRVDLRLRPYGRSGALVPTMRAIEAYYRSHAEFWEVQALIRSRVIVGGPSLEVRWKSLVEKCCFSHSLSELTLDALLENRHRTESEFGEEDLKRGAGGIRDVEFLVQTMQLAFGHNHRAVRVPNTLLALEALKREGLLAAKDHDGLAHGYRLLRQVEHRCQLIDDQQTHTLPSDRHQRSQISKTLGFADWQAFFTEMARRRAVVREIYERLAGDEQLLPEVRSRIRRRAGQFADELSAWFDGLPEPGSFYDALLNNEGSYARVIRLVEVAPALAKGLSASVALTEGVVSGEIEEETGFGDRISRCVEADSVSKLGRAFADDWNSIIIRWSLAGQFDLGSKLSKLVDSCLSLLYERAGGEVDILAAGSYATGELSIGSDADLVILTEGNQSEAEAKVQNLLAEIEAMRRFGSPLKVDLRLRPEGGKGLLVRTYAGFSQYELEHMEMWERFALGHVRLVKGSPEGLKLVCKASYAVPLTPERLKELVAMKRRIETERVAPQYAKRQVKLGYGGLSDLDWFTQLHEMRYPTATHAGSALAFDDRVRNLAESGLINSIEKEWILKARRHLLNLRAHLALLGCPDDIVPENPDKLERLGTVLGFESGNAFLIRHIEIIDFVRHIYLEGLERLRA